MLKRNLGVTPFEREAFRRGGTAGLVQMNFSPGLSLKTVAPAGTGIAHVPAEPVEAMMALDIQPMGVGGGVARMSSVRILDLRYLNVKMFPPLAMGGIVFGMTGNVFNFMYGGSQPAITILEKTTDGTLYRLTFTKPATGQLYILSDGSSGIPQGSGWLGKSA